MWAYALFTSLEALDIFEAYAFAQTKRQGPCRGVLGVAEGYVGKLDITKLVAWLVKATQLYGIALYNSPVHI